MSDKKTDAIVMELLNKVEDKKKQIGNAERPSWQTNCSFGYDAASNARINIQTANMAALIEMYSFLLAKIDYYTHAVQALGIPAAEAPFRWLGFTADEWMSDIQTRLNGLRIKSKKDELVALEARVNALVSPEQRRAMEIEKLAKELNG